MSPVDAVLAVIIGIVLALIGYRVIRFMSSILFGALLGLAGFTLMQALVNSMVLSIIAAAILFILGLIVGFVVFKASLAIVGGYVLASIILATISSLGYNITFHQGILMFVLTIVFAAMLYVVIDYMLAVGSAIIGGLFVFLGLNYWLPPILSLPIAIALVIGGGVYQVKHLEERK